MSEDLQAYLRSRARVGETPLGLGLLGALGVHGAVALAAFLAGRHAPAPAEEKPKVTWIAMPAAQSAPAGGSEGIEQGKQGERLRQVEEVAPQRDEGKAVATQQAPDPFALKQTKSSAKGTNPNPESTGTAPTAAKSKTPVTAPPTMGAAGSGNSGGLGIGSSIPGLNPTSGTAGGVGLIGGTEGGDFPFLWYLQQVQSRVTSNWNRVSSAQGRVQVYFRIKRDGSVEGVRVESPSGSTPLDESARLAVLRAAPMQPLPSGFEGPYLGVRFWFTYLGK